MTLWWLILIVVFALEEGHAKTIPCSFLPSLLSLCFFLWVWTYFRPSPLAIFLFYPFTLHGIWKQPGRIERRMRGQYAQGNQGGDNGIEVSQQKGHAFILLAIITSFFPSSISYMTSGIHGRGSCNSLFHSCSHFSAAMLTSRWSLCPWQRLFPSSITFE